VSQGGQNQHPKIRQLFGTDGIRGVAGAFPLDAATVYGVGKALATRIDAPNRRVVIGMDTRESSPWITGTLAGGLAAANVEAVSAGVITTPGVAFLTRTQGFAAGVVVSASHNPWEDNGIKIFGADGYKLSDETEHAIEQDIFTHRERADGRQLSPPESQKLHASYADWLVSHVQPGSLSRLRVVVDCANGATTALAPEVIHACGVKAEFMNVNPDGRNINQDCGALHPQVVARQVARRGGFDLGISFDGDGDRALFSDDAGNVVNGDAVLLLAARDMKRRGTLRADTVVATTMSNMGLEAALRNSGLSMVRAAVGDRYVLEEMRRTGAVLGGEQSGHIIFLDGESTTGDGLLTAVRVMQIMADSGRPLAELIHDLHTFPQTIKNIRVREKKPLDEVPEVKLAIDDANREIGHDGRIVVRYSGTEPLVRVMVEAATEEQMNRIAGRIAEAIKRSLGA
jgi:phosphoglucosamine mutase